MFFQIDVTPKEKKAPGQSTSQKTAESSNYSLLLAPFQPPTRIKLDARINTSATCQLTLRNTNQRTLTVTIAKFPPQERKISLSDTKWTIQPESNVTFEIAWQPQEAGSWRDVLQLSDSRHIKYDVPLILTCTDPHRKAPKRDGRPKRMLPLSSKVNSLQNIKKNSSTLPKVTGSKSKVHSDLENSRPVADEFANKENVSRNMNTNWMLEQARKKKQRNESSVGTPLDFSRFLDSSTFQFTPIKPQFSGLGSNDARDAFATPQSNIGKVNESWLLKQEASSLTVESKVQVTALRKETFVTVPKYLNLHDLKDPDDNGKYDDSLSPKTPEPKGPQSEFSKLFDDIKFTPLKCSSTESNFSPNHCSTATKSSKTNLPNDTPDSQTSKNATFSIDNSEGNVTYELPKSPTSARSHIKPTCLAKSFGNNLDADFVSPLDVQNTLSTTHTPCERSRLGNLFSKSQVDFGSAKDCLEADLWVKSKKVSLSPVAKNIMHSTLDSIAEEDIKHLNDIGDNENVCSAEHEQQQPRRQAVCIEISPPKYEKGKSPMRRVSPTKKSKIMKERCILEAVKSKKKQINESIKNNKSIDIPGVRISKLSFKDLYRDKGSCKTVKKQPKEVSVKLHDPNDFLSMFCNPDPFAPTMTCDPFLANTIYYDDRWVFMQEVQFKKWLNMLLSPPEQLTTDIDSAIIDIGKVWQSCRSKDDVALAETKESVSARYHTNARLNSLRKLACAMYRTSEIMTVLTKVTVAIEKELLVIRTDKDLHRDIGLQKIILELFISYNPLWLRIGLETVYGETIPLQSNNDMIGLTRFLLHRFFADPFIVKQHSSQTHSNIRLKTFQAAMNKFILKKFLFLVYFLDYAKTNKLIGHDPCLFHKKAGFKESREILLTFSRELLSGIGDVTKKLRQYGYVVSHKQSILDEYDYAVESLSSDLRDGVRLCRVMELMTGNNHGLTSRCRVPAISRTQKIHNVGVALAAVKEAGYTITGSIDAKSIADGHREKTLSLLWQLIYKFQAPRFETAAKTIQSWWRSKLWYVNLKNLLRRRKHDAASVIQRAWRCRAAKRQLRLLKEEYARELRSKNEAAAKIQLRWRLKKEAERERRRYRRLVESAVKIQKWWRRRRETEPYVREFARSRELVTRLQRRWRANLAMRADKSRYERLRASVIAIQRRWRARKLGDRVRRDYRSKRNAIILAQRKWRATLAARRERRAYLRKIQATREIQAWWRRRLCAKRDRDNFVALKRAVLTIERVWRYWHTETEERKRYLAAIRAVVLLQRSWRNHLATRADVAAYRAKKQACLRIQTWWRCRAAARRYRDLRSSCLKIQSWYRGIVSGREQRSRYLVLRGSAIVLQKNWRMILARRAYRSRKSAALKIASWYRNIVAGRAARERYLRMKAAVSRIEAWYLRLKDARQTRTRFLETKAATIAVQRRWRAQLVGRAERKTYLRAKSSATKIQAWWRMILTRRRYQRMKIAVNRIEAWYLRLKDARLTKARFLETKAAAIVVQRRWRAQLVGRAERKTYLRAKSSATKIQAWWRMILTRRRYQRMKIAVDRIEAWYLRLKDARQTKARFLETKAAAIVVQRRWRAQLAGRAERETYLRSKSSATKIQAWWRMILARRSYVDLVARKNAAIVVQNRWRALARGREVRSKFARCKASTILVQRKWRATLLARRERTEFMLKRRAAVVVQKHWRGLVARRDFARTKTAVSKIESWRICVLRGRRVRAEYLELKTTVVRMQQFARTKRQAREFQKCRGAAIAIQRFWRSTLLARECKARYESQRAAAIALQRRYRARMVAEQVRSDFRRKVSSIRAIQLWWRCILAQRRLKLERERQRWAVAVIEDWWTRAAEQRRVREIERAQNARRYRACVRIQAAWRGFRVRRAASKKISLLRERAKVAAKAAVPSATLASRLQENIEMFRYASNIGQLSVCLSSLDVITRLSPNACVNVCQLNLVPRLYDILNRANRSLPWLDICSKVLSILLTLAKFKPTKQYVLQEEHIEVLVRLLTISVDKKDDLFLHAATLLWVLTEDEKYSEAVQRCSRTKYLLSCLYTSINKKLNKSTLNVAKHKEEDSLPSPKPDWGLNYRRPRIFGSITKAITSIAERLKILNITPQVQANNLHRSFNFSM